MTNTEKLRIEMIKSNLSSKAIAEQLGITDNSFSRKLNNLTEFKASEIRIVSQMLYLSNDSIADIFFGFGVD